MRFEFFEENPGLEAEHAAVPEVVACIQVLLCRRGIGLFMECEDIFPGRLDIAEPCFGVLRRDAESDKVILLRQGLGPFQHLPVGRNVADQVV